MDGMKEMIKTETSIEYNANAYKEGFEAALKAVRLKLEIAHKGNRSAEDIVEALPVWLSSK